MVYKYKRKIYKLFTVKFNNENSLNLKCYVNGKNIVYLATANKARTIFSPSPIHFDVSDDALMLKNVDLDCDAMHFAKYQKHNFKFSKFKFNFLKLKSKYFFFF